MGVFCLCCACAHVAFECVNYARRYFHCDNHGCDPTQPLALNLTDPFNANSDFVLSWQFQMPYSDPSADLHNYQVVVWGKSKFSWRIRGDFFVCGGFALQHLMLTCNDFLFLAGSDQDHTPYDFSATIDYNVTTSKKVSAPKQHPIRLN